MPKLIKKLITSILILILTVSLTVCSFAESVNVAYEAAATENYYLSTNAVTNGSSLSEYLALIYSGFTVLNDSYLNGKDGVILLATEIITNAAEGKDVNKEKTDSLISLQKDDGSFGTIEETCLAMIALKAADAIFPSEKSVNFILSCQDEEGLFKVSEDDKENIETTALVLTVLSPYKASTDVFNAIKKTVEKLNAIQNEDGSFADGSSITLAKLISAFADIGESSNIDVWHNMPELLLKYKNEDGSYKEYLTDQTANPEATAEALCAYHALASGNSPISKLMNTGKLSSFEITDILPFAILYGIVLAGSIVFWIFVLKKKKNTRTLEDAKKEYELC